MPDRLTALERSEHMRRIRKRDTKPELVVRRLVHSLGARFRLHKRDLPGTPDLTLSARKLVIQVHGCFWHQHPGCRLARVPRSRPEYWLPKLQRNVERDESTRAALEALGWRCVVVWECETADQTQLRERLSEILSSGEMVLHLDQVAAHGRHL